MASRLNHIKNMHKSKCLEKDHNIVVLVSQADYKGGNENTFRCC